MTTKISSILAGVALAVVGALHLLWTREPWPWTTASEMRSAVFGDSGTDVPKVAYVGMGGALVAAGALVLMQGRVIRRIAPPRLRAVAMYVLSGGLLARGVGGFLMNSGASDEFRHLNTWFYSPLCIVLAILTYSVQRTESESRPLT